MWRDKKKGGKGGRMGLEGLVNKRLSLFRAKDALSIQAGLTELGIEGWKERKRERGRKRNEHTSSGSVHRSRDMWREARPDPCGVWWRWLCDHQSLSRQ